VETLETAIVGSFFRKAESRKYKLPSQAAHFHEVRRQMNCHATEQNPVADMRQAHLFTDDPQVFPQISCAYTFKSQVQKAKKEA
jgi:hypothetical protein